MSKTSIIELADVTKSYDDETVLDHINLKIANQEFMTLLGPSGCGKTTTLRIIGGFTYPDSGSVYYEGNNITFLPPYKRKVNTVFQKYALFPFLNVYENVAFGLRIKKLSEKDIRNRVMSMLDLVNLKGFEKRDVTAMSGGQQQRVAIARALVNMPTVLLLDEPLGALDLKLRKEMQIELKSMQQRLGITFVYVTHDQEEALTMSDTIVVMNQGVIQQIGTPIDVYNEPKNAFVADFIGESNIFPGVMNSDYQVSFANCDFRCVDKGFGVNEEVDAVVRPEDVKVTNLSDCQVSGIVESITFKGVHYEIIVAQDERKWMIHSTQAPQKGSTVGLLLYPDDIHIMKKESKK